MIPRLAAWLRARLVAGASWLMETRVDPRVCDFPNVTDEEGE